jgi:hypothetical protein
MLFQSRSLATAVSLAPHFLHWANMAHYYETVYILILFEPKCTHHMLSVAQDKGNRLAYLSKCIHLERKFYSQIDRELTWVCNPNYFMCVQTSVFFGRSSEGSRTRDWFLSKYLTKHRCFSDNGCLCTALSSSPARLNYLTSLLLSDQL